MNYFKQINENTFLINQFNNSHTLIFHKLNDNVLSNIQFIIINMIPYLPFVFLAEHHLFQVFRMLHLKDLFQHIGII